MTDELFSDAELETLEYSVANQELSPDTFVMITRGTFRRLIDACKSYKKQIRHNMCSICAGTKILLTGENCACGDGTAAGEAILLRDEIVTLRVELHKTLCDWQDEKVKNRILEKLR